MWFSLWLMQALGWVWLVAPAWLVGWLAG